MCTYEEFEIRKIMKHINKSLATCEPNDIGQSDLGWLGGMRGPVGGVNLQLSLGFQSLNSLNEGSCSTEGRESLGWCGDLM